MQVRDAELAQVRQPLAHARQRPGEAVDVGHVADRLLALEPVRRDLALVVEHPQLRRARRRGRADRAQQPLPRGREPRVVPVQREQRVAQLGEEALEAHGERAVAGDQRARRVVVRAHLRAHRVDVLHAAGP